MKPKIPQRSNDDAELQRSQSKGARTATGPMSMILATPTLMTTVF